MNSAADILVDPGQIEQRREQKRIEYETITIPTLRFLGYNLILLLVLAAEKLVRGTIEWRSFIIYAATAEIYSLLSWIALRRLVPRWRDAGVLFLSLDVPLWTAAIYLTGGASSPLFLLLLVRIADQTNTSFRRVVTFAHLVTICYAVMLAWIVLHDRTPVALNVEVAKVLFLYVAGWYLALTARTAENLRNSTVSAIRLARSSIKRLEDTSNDLTTALHAATESTRAKNEFLANMSHELRTPLNSVIGFANVLRRNVDTTPEKRAVYLDRIADNANNLLATIDDVLNVASIESGRVDVYVTEVDVSELIADVVQGVHAKPSVTVSYDALPGATMSTDRQLLRTALQHLVGNAVKFTNAGSITVRLLDRNGRPGVIEVQDTGPGIPPEQLPLIFRAFAQGDNSSARRFGGSGLGLSIASSFCTLLGCSLSVESEVGHGSIFRIHFGLAKNEQETAKGDSLLPTSG